MRGVSLNSQSVRFISSAIVVVFVISHSITATSGAMRAAAKRHQQCVVVNRHPVSAASPTPVDILTIPIYLAASASTVSSGSSISITAEVDSIPNGGGAIMVGCTIPSAFMAPGGSWPYTMSFPSGGPKSRTFLLIAGSVSSAQDVQLYTYLTDATDPTDPACWQQVITVHVVPQ